MKKIQYYISALLLVAVAAMSLTSCGEDKLGPTIFPDVDETLDPNSHSYQLDKFLRTNYLEKYNLTFLYKMPDISTNMNYNLVPADYTNSVDLAVLCKHLWFDVYDKVAGSDFLKLYGPRIILLVGSPAINADSGSETVGLAEGGIKITLFKVNSMNVANFQQMNDLYFHTMHHEFAHILHQTKTYPTEFNTISVGRYDPNNWQYRGDEVTSLGFVTPYGSSEYREDFAETIACFIVYTETEWNRLLELASRGWATSASDDDLDAVYYSYYYYPNNDNEQEITYVDERYVITVEDEDGTVHLYYRNERDKQGNRIVVYEVEDKDGIDGRDAILQKVQIARQWFHDAWNVDLDALREEVQTRQATYWEKMDELRQMVYGIQ
jgi:substrate import-associated zinc metallohydrolase lipoprotein